MQGSPWGDRAQVDSKENLALHPQGREACGCLDGCKPDKLAPAKAAGHGGSTVVDTTDSRHQTSLTQHPRCVQVARPLAEPLCAGFLLGEMKHNCEIDHREDYENHQKVFSDMLGTGTGLKRALVIRITKQGRGVPAWS